MFHSCFIRDEDLTLRVYLSGIFIIQNSPRISNECKRLEIFNKILPISANPQKPE